MLFSYILEFPLIFSNQDYSSQKTIQRIQPRTLNTLIPSTFVCIPTRVTFLGIFSLLLWRKGLSRLDKQALNSLCNEDRP